MKRFANLFFKDLLPDPAPKSTPTIHLSPLASPASSSASASTPPSSPSTSGTSSSPPTSPSATSATASSPASSPGRDPFSMSPGPSSEPSPASASASHASSPLGSVSSRTSHASSGYVKLTIRDLLEPSCDLQKLSVRQIKYVLLSNCIDVKHVLEKSELVGMLQKLIQEYRKELEHESKFCKICMEVPSNCVLLECGHMGICVACARKCAECPFCRQNIVRVVHTFSP